MKLAVSNIAWGNGEEPAIFALLRRYGVAGIEVAPTRFWPDWTGAVPAAARIAARRLADEGFMVPSLQAILFGKPELNLFDDSGAFADHIRRIADLATEFGARILVFGAPRNRDRGALTPEAAFERAIAIFRCLGRDCAEREVKLCIEPNPPAYGCNFVTDSRDGMALVDAVASPGFGLHLDTGGLALAQEDPAQAVTRARNHLAHLHISEPHLAPIVPATIDHAGVGRALRQIAYSGWTAIEMRRSAEPLSALARSLEHALACYRGRLHIGAPILSSVEAVA
jgi:sugar phosphate isomerase/epimerase